MQKITESKFIHLILVCVLPLTGLTIDIYTPAFPALQHFFGTSHSMIKLTISLYLLGFGAGQVFAGLLSDRFGRRPIMLTGLAIIVLASLLAAFSQNISLFFTARILQGLSVAATTTTCRAILADYFHGNDLRKVSVHMVMAWTTTPIIAPFIGSYLQTFISWRADFVFVAIYALLFYIIIFSRLPETNKNPRSIHPKELLLNGIEVLSNKFFMSLVFCLAIGFALIALFNTFAPFLYQVHYQFSLLAYGHLALYVGTASFLGSLSNRFIFKNSPINITIAIGILIIIIGASSLLTLMFLGSQPALVVTTCIYVTLFGVGLIYPNLSAICSSMFKEKAGLASALRGTVSILVAALITGIASYSNSQNALAIAWFYTILAWLALIIAFSTSAISLRKNISLQ